MTGQVLYVGQKITIEWKHTLPNIPLPGCESEVWLSLDGGRTFPMWITFLDLKKDIFPRTVPNTPTNAAVTGYSFRVRLALSRKLRSAACIDVHHREEWSANVLKLLRISPFGSGGTANPSSQF